MCVWAVGGGGHTCSPPIVVVTLGGGGGGWPAPADRPAHPHQKSCPPANNEIYQRGWKFEAHFRHTNFFLASDPSTYPPPPRRGRVSATLINGLHLGHRQFPEGARMLAVGTPPCVNGALDSHPFFPSHVASGRCFLSAAAAGALAGVVSALAEPSGWCWGCAAPGAPAVSGRCPHARGRYPPPPRGSRTCLRW